MMERKRIIMLDGLKLFAIFLVLWGHSIQHLFSFPSQDELLFRIIYSFHMPLFMIMSGFFSYSVIKEKFSDLLRKKSISLILPAICGASIYIIFNNNDLGGGISSLWYLKSLFICIIFYYLFFKVIPLGNWNWRLISSLAISQIIPLGLLSDLFPFFMGGIYLKRYFESIQKNALVIMFISGTVWIVMLFFYSEDFWFIKDIFKGQYYTDFMTGSPVLIYTVMRIYKFSIGFAGAIFFISLFLLFENKIESNKVASNICAYGKYTLGVYIIQTFVLEMFLPIILTFDGMNRYIAVWFVCPIISTFLLIAILQLIKIIEKNKILSLMILGRVKYN